MGTVRTVVYVRRPHWFADEQPVSQHRPRTEVPTPGDRLKNRTPEHWIEILRKVGVAPIVAGVWSQAFSDFFTGPVFSSGDHELPDFLSQILHESGNLAKLEENLSYSPKRMTEVWPTRFPTIDSTVGYSFNPRALANKVYGGRYGNKDADDGWKYRGSGPIQLTFYDNYLFVERKLGLPLTSRPELLRVPGPAVLKVSHAWWEGKVPDSVIGNPRLVRKAVNGGTLGLPATTALYNQLKGLL